MAADSYARITGKIGVAMVTSGPGGTNTITGLMCAWQDSTPCLIISGQCKKKETVHEAHIPGLRQFGALAVDILPVVKSMTKYAVVVDDPKGIRYHLEKAIYLAKNGRPGPVWLDIPVDIQGSFINVEELKGFHPDVKSISDHDTELDKKIEKIIKLLKKARKPVIVAGNGIRIAGAVDEFNSLIAKLNIPVVSGIMGVDIIHDSHPLFVGRIGTKGERAANMTIQNSDLIISIGSRLSVPLIGYEYEKFAPDAKKIVVDIDGTEHKKKTIKIDLLVISDAKVFLDKLSERLNNLTFSFKSNWSNICRNLRESYPVCLPEYAKQTPLNIHHFVDKISDVMNNKDIITTDAGSAFYVVRQAIKIKKGQRLILPSSSGSMGFALPASTGACLANKKNRVICIVGDGSFQTNIHELQTIVYNKLPIKIFVLNNNGYLSIRNTQSLFLEKRLIGESESSGVSFPSTKKIAGAYGIKFTRISNSININNKLKKVLDSTGPEICEIICQTNHLIIPTVSSKKLPDGKLVSTSIDDMYPFLSEKEMKEIKQILS
jgi:acetolactate synthase-1/2/3 large subunit